ncbi:7TM diverse intracellular signaling domain-containing protein [uncultured Polaribacter sp.]|uniref:7TM diverse intracellular signaling domain-containing protein n=1 Tax=uncultured Polaribacter sp. TaxID=174711 RepID=UPI00263219AB|nr:7TM diverse intracellular signaling domain-containing protein [uncultured Polaribacter sp.]
MPSIIKRIWLLPCITLFFIFISLKTAGQKNIEKEISFTNYNISYLKDNNYKINDIINSYTFIKLPKSNSLGKKNGVYWMKLNVRNSTSSELIAYIPTHNIDRIDVYNHSNNTTDFITSTGNSILKNDLAISYKFPAFKILQNKKIQSTYYLKVIFPKEANFPLKILYKKDFLSYVMEKKTINSLYYGTAIAVIILNFFFFFKFRDKIYLYYLLFLTSLTFNFLLYDGSLIGYFRGNDTYYKLEFLIHISNEIWFLLFSVKFLDLHKRRPVFTKIIYLFPITVLLLYACYSITNKFIFIAIADAVGISLFPILWIFGIYYLKKIPSARFYVLGYLLIIPFSVYFILGYPFGYWEVFGDMNIVKIASWLDMIVFTYAISNKMKNKIEQEHKNTKQLQKHIRDKTSKIDGNYFKTDSYLAFLKVNDISNKPLTLREVEILRYLNEDLNNNQIAEKLFISTNTVKYHIRNIYSKISVKNRKELKEKTYNLNTLKPVTYF